MTIEYLEHSDGSVEPKKLGLGFKDFPPFIAPDPDAVGHIVLGMGVYLRADRVWRGFNVRA